MTARVLVTPPAAEDPVLTLIEAKAHLRLTHDAEDDYVEALVEAAVLHAELVTERRFVSQTWDLKLDRFPRQIELPFPPLQSITSITYVDTAGDEQTLSSSVYTVDTASEPGRVYLAYDQTWPAIRSIPNAVTVTFVCGFGAAADVPASVKHGVKIIVAHWFENREPVAHGSTPTHIPMTAHSLLMGEAVPEAT